ncbi:MAG TPA: hypothetical protein VFQ22_00150, partial [Longimicrobiales bacterium]|nr:hypothetical protein [Longimicrobiales bacterium]
VRRAALDVDAESLALLLRGSAVAVPEAPPGPVAIRSGGEVLGRGTVTSAGLVSEIPKARAADLLRALEAGGG